VQGIHPRAFSSSERARGVRLLLYFACGGFSIFQRILKDSHTLVMGPGQIFLLPVLGRVSHFRFGVGKIPPKIPNFTIFSLGVKKNCFRQGQKVLGPKTGPASYLLRVKSMLGSGQVRTHL